LHLDTNHEKFCRYYQAQVEREQAWFFVAIARSYEHIMFDRTLDPQTSMFEFFVPADMEPAFLEVMAQLVEHGIVTDLRSLDNRLKNPDEVV
jgi:hypothetical protein